MLTNHEDGRVAADDDPHPHQHKVNELARLVCDRAMSLQEASTVLALLLGKDVASPTRHVTSSSSPSPRKSRPRSFASGRDVADHRVATLVEPAPPPFTAPLQNGTELRTKRPPAPMAPISPEGDQTSLDWWRGLLSEAAKSH